MSTITQRKPTRASAYLVDKEKAEKLLKAYIDLQSDKSAIDESMKKAKSELEAFAKKYRTKENTIQLDNGTLRFGSRTEVKTMRSFSLITLVKKFPDLLKEEFKTAAVKALTTAKLKTLGLKLTKRTEFEIVTKTTS